MAWVLYKRFLFLLLLFSPPFVTTMLQPLTEALSALPFFFSFFFSFLFSIFLASILLALIILCSCLCLLFFSNDYRHRSQSRGNSDVDFLCHSMPHLVLSHLLVNSRISPERYSTNKEEKERDNAQKKQERSKHIPLLSVVTIWGSLLVSADIPSLATKIVVYVVPGLRVLTRIVRSLETEYDFWNSIGSPERSQLRDCIFTRDHFIRTFINFSILNIIMTSWNCHDRWIKWNIEERRSSMSDCKCWFWWNY